MSNYTIGYEYEISQIHFCDERANFETALNTFKQESKNKDISNETAKSNFLGTLWLGGLKQDDKILRTKNNTANGEPTLTIVSDNNKPEVVSSILTPDELLEAEGYLNFLDHFKATTTKEHPVVKIPWADFKKISSVLWDKAPDFEDDSCSVVQIGFGITGSLQYTAGFELKYLFKFLQYCVKKPQAQQPDHKTQGPFEDIRSMYLRTLFHSNSSEAARFTREGYFCDTPSSFLMLKKNNKKLSDAIAYVKDRSASIDTTNERTKGLSCYFIFLMHIATDIKTTNRTGYVKQHFPLMSRTNIESIYRKMDEQERNDFVIIVNSWLEDNKNKLGSGVDVKSWLTMITEQSIDPLKVSEVGVVFSEVWGGKYVDTDKSMSQYDSGDGCKEVVIEMRNFSYHLPVLKNKYNGRSVHYHYTPAVLPMVHRVVINELNNVLNDN